MKKKQQLTKEQRRAVDEERRRTQPERMLVKAVMLFFFSAFLLISLKETVDWQGLLLALVVPALIYAATMWMPKFFPTDKLLMAIVNFLCALGVLILYSTDNGQGLNRGLQQAGYYGAGLAAMVVCILLVRFIRRWRVMIWIVGAGALAIIALPLAIGTEINGATNWISLGGISLQPSEVVKIALVLVLSYFMSRRSMLPWLGFLGVCMLILMLQKDLGTALVYFSTALILYYANTGNLLMTGLGLAGAGGAAVFGYWRFAHVKRRVEAWINPWKDYEDVGYQMAQVLMAIASGGLFGVGLGLGAPRVIPVYFTDCIFAVICEQFGILFGILTLVLYVILIVRGTSVAISARRGFHGLIAMGVTAMLGMQTFIIIGGVIKLIPLTGVTMPFVSYGGTSMVSCMGLIGLLQGVHSINQDDLGYDYEISRALAQQAGMNVPEE